MNRLDLLKKANKNLPKKGAITTPDGRRNPAAASEYLGCSISKLACMRSAGSGPLYIKKGGVWYYKEDLDFWSENLKSEKITPHSKGGPKTNRDKHLALRVTPETFEAVQQAADDTHRTASNWVETAILWALDQGAVKTRQVVPRPKGD